VWSHAIERHSGRERDRRVVFEDLPTQRDAVGRSISDGPQTCALALSRETGVGAHVSLACGMDDRQAMLWRDGRFVGFQVGVRCAQTGDSGPAAPADPARRAAGLLSVESTARRPRVSLA
jgi:hypothetical protein